jgi:hypothetical protein
VSQDLVSVKTHLNALTDSSFYGRGYVNNGSNLAAAYLVDQFKELGLRKPKKGFLQKFEILVNTYPETLILSFNDDPLRSGYDFIVNPRTGSSSGNYPIKVLDSTYFQSKAEWIEPDTVPAIDMDGIDTPEETSSLFEFKREILAGRPVVQLEKKLTWSVGQQSADQAEISMLESSFPRDADSLYIQVQNQMQSLEIANVMGFVPGKRKDSIVVFTAHYDHLGMMGTALFPGASDNASGTSMLLDLAHHYSKEKPEFTTWFICFAGEEAGLAGSKFFVDNPQFDLSSVKLLLNLDLMGSAAEGIAVVNGKKYPQMIEKLSAINSEQNLVGRIKVRGQAANSDHYWFAERGVPAIFIYTMGNITAYHDVYDTSQVVDWAKYPEVFTLITEFVSSL